MFWLLKVLVEIREINEKEKSSIIRHIAKKKKKLYDKMSRLEIKNCVI